MTLTKAALFEHAKPRVALVKNVPVFGDVWIRSCPQVQLSRRMVSYQEPENQAKEPVHRIIDQVMSDETTPMFTEDDIDALGELDAEKLAPLFIAIEAFNGDDQKKAPEELSDTSES